MGIFRYGPLQVQVDYIGLLPAPWQEPWGKPEHRYNLLVSDRHGNSFEAGWSTEKSEEKMARLIITLLAYAKSEGRDWDFYGGYGGEERTWRRHQAERIQEALKKFKEVEIYRAGGIAYRQEAYERERGPKDWSPLRELRESE